MIIKEINAKSILSASKIYKYVINPYVGCHYGCTYCYARFMKRFTGHVEPWGGFVDVKVNAIELLIKEIARKKPDCVWISGVCDPYQPLESKYRLTRGCLEILLRDNWPVRLQLKSDLVVRDIDILMKGNDCDVGLSIPTADDSVRALFEPKATKIEDRIKTLKELHAAGIRTYAMIAPVLPGADRLLPLLKGTVDYIYVDRMNYGYADYIYKKNKLENYLTNAFFSAVKRSITGQSKEWGIPCSIFY